jgi:hypothetical protein
MGDCLIMKSNKKKAVNGKSESSVIKNGIHSTKEANAGLALFDDEPCTVGFSASYTKNLGNYESMKVEVRIDIPCQHNEINSMFDFCKSWCDDRLNNLQDELDK